MKSISIFLTFFLGILAFSYGQQKPITIEEERGDNNITLFAINNTLTDYDVSITIKGTGFRQRGRADRKTRVPGRSRVNLVSLIPERGKEPNFVYILDITDSLSRRVIRKDYELIKVNPPKPIVVYIPENCLNCEKITAELDESPFLYKTVLIAESESVHPYIKNALKGTDQTFETLDCAVLNIGGKIYPGINSYKEIEEKLEEK